MLRIVSQIKSKIMAVLENELTQGDSSACEPAQSLLCFWLSFYLSNYEIIFIEIIFTQKLYSKITLVQCDELYCSMF